MADGIWKGVQVQPQPRLLDTLNSFCEGKGSKKKFVEFSTKGGGAAIFHEKKHNGLKTLEFA